MPTITKAAFGETKEGAPVDLYHLENKHGLKAQIMTFGATLRLMSLPNEQGETVNITLSREILRSIYQRVLLLWRNDWTRG